MKKEKQPEILAIKWAAAAVILVSPMGLMQPFFAPVFSESVWMMPAAGGLIGIGAIVLWIEAAFKRRPSLGVAFLALLACAASGFYLAQPQLARAAWERKFIQNRDRFERAVRETTGKPANWDDRNRETVALPADLRGLAMRGSVRRFRNEKGEVWYQFPQFMSGIDNGVGYAWSATGKRPPSGGYYHITRVQSLGNGWYLFWTT